MDPPHVLSNALARGDLVLERVTGAGRRPRVPGRSTLAQTWLVQERCVMADRHVRVPSTKVVGDLLAEILRL
jgi:hypothetical protein